jgi:nucleotide-binding universal stress UspA family protein
MLVGLREKEGPSPAVLQWATEVAAATQHHVSVLEAVEAVDAERPPGRAEVQRGWARADLRHEIDADVHGAAAATIDRVRISEGAADDVIEQRARDVSAEMVVVGDADGGVGALGLGGLAHGLAHRLPCPIVRVPGGSHAPVGGWVVVGIDGSEGSRVALRWAEQLARSIDAHVSAVYAINDIYDTFNSHGWYGGDERDAQFEAAAEHQVITFTERTGEPVTSLEAEADERDAGLIVVAARRRHSLHGHLLGGVADRLLHASRHPVAVLPYDYVTQRLATNGDTTA